MYGSYEQTFNKSLLELTYIYFHHKLSSLLGVSIDTCSSYIKGYLHHGEKKNSYRLSVEFQSVKMFHTQEKDSMI